MAGRNGGIIGPNKVVCSPSTKVTSFTASGTFQKKNCTSTIPEILVVAGGAGGGCGGGAAAGAFSIANLDIDGGTDIGEAIVDAALFIVDNGAGGTNRKVAASRLTTYINANANFASVGKAIAMAIVFG